MYDYLIVGAGLSGAIFAHEATKRGKKVKVIDKRDHIGGNIYCEDVEGITFTHGAHIFHIPQTKKVHRLCVNQFNNLTTISITNYNYKGIALTIFHLTQNTFMLKSTKTPSRS